MTAVRVYEEMSEAEKAESLEVELQGAAAEAEVEAALEAEEQGRPEVLA
jgi:TusA-related sulfurtransferase